MNPAHPPLVNFMIVGAAKSGTTSLARLLALHPSICISDPKEIYYFNKTIDWDNPEKLKHYHSHFHNTPNKIVGEASTLYSDFPRYLDTEQRIFAYNPNMKIIFIMRNPVDRIYSHYKHLYAMSKLRLKVSEMETELLNDPLYVNRSKYYMQISPYIKLFGRQNVHLCFFEDYKENPTGVLDDILEFLGAEKGFFHGGDFNFHHNPSEKLRILTPFGQTIASLPIIKFLPRGFKWKFRRPFERKMIKFPEMSDRIKEHLLRALETDLGYLSSITHKDIYKMWKIGKI